MRTKAQCLWKTVKLVAGRSSSTGVTATAELYNSSPSTFTATGSINDAREFSQLTLLQNGEALIAAVDEK